MTSYQRALKQRALTTAAAALATALFATACGDAGGDTADTTSESEEQVAESNDADVVFARMMIPHHEQAVTMADLADTRAGDEVGELAVEIRDAQGPEIEQMETLLDSWGAGRGSDMDHSDMGGMLTEEQMNELGNAEGDRFDTLFLEFMVLHHEGAVEMARTELDDGINPEARELAQEIVDAQEAEIRQMNEMLGVEGSEGEGPGAEATEDGDHSGH